MYNLISKIESKMLCKLLHTTLDFSLWNEIGHRMFFLPYFLKGKIKKKNPKVLS